MNATRALRRDTKVLVVDDEMDSTVVMLEYLKGQGFGVGCAGNGQEALDWIEQNGHPDVILLDLNMPVMNGQTFMTEYAGPAVIIVVTAWSRHELPGEPYQVLCKPLHLASLPHLIEKAVKANGGPKWARFLPCKHTCVGVGIKDMYLTFQCLIPNCEKSKTVHIERIDFETMAELTLSIAQDTLARREECNLS